MVLYENDLSNQFCLIDVKTHNLSFLRMSVLLGKMGIKNNKFMLVLTQPELQGVDPHALDLSQQMQARVAYEAKVNPWYFFREVMRIPAQGGDPIRYLLNRANLALIWCYLNNLDAYLTMPRQIGKTVGVLSIADYFLYVYGKNCNIAMFAKDADLRTENVRRVKELREGLPPYMFKAGQAFNTNNQETVEYKPSTTKYITFVAQSDTKRAAKQGRGESFVWSHWDEFAFYENNDLAYPSAISASSKVKELARANGLSCATLITTTAGFTSTKAGKYAFNFTNKAMRFTEKLYDVADKEELAALMEAGSANGFVYLEFSYLQLGKDEKWFKEVTRNIPPEVISTDFLNKWIHGTSKPIVPQKLLDKMEANVEEPISITIEENVILRWHAEQTTLNQPEFKAIPFFIGSDTSDNVGKDFTTLVLINPKDMAVVMTCRCNQANMVHIATAIFKLLERFPNAIFIPERNKAATLLDVLIHMIMTKTNWDPFKRIFNTYIQDKGNTVDYNKLDLELGSVRKAFGFYTGADSRKTLYSAVLNTTLERNYARIFDKQIVDEASGLVERNGRVDHAVSGNDDTLIAYLIACWLVMYGKNMYLYGLDESEILSLGDDVVGDSTTTQIDIHKRIRYLEDKLDSGSMSSIMEQAFTGELRELKTMIVEQDGYTEGIISIHQVTNNENRDKVPDTIEFIENQFRSLFG